MASSERHSAFPILLPTRSLNPFHPPSLLPSNLYPPTLPSDPSPCPSPSDRHRVPSSDWRCVPPPSMDEHNVLRQTLSVSNTNSGPAPASQTILRHTQSLFNTRPTPRATTFLWRTQCVLCQMPCIDFLSPRGSTLCALATMDRCHDPSSPPFEHIELPRHSSYINAACLMNNAATPPLHRTYIFCPSKQIGDVLRPIHPSHPPPYLSLAPCALL